MPPTRAPCPNPLFVLWLGEWKRQAKDKLKADLAPPSAKNVYINLKKAHTAMQAYPYPLATGLDARFVPSIGDTIASRLQKRLEMHHRVNQASTSSPESPNRLVTSPGFARGPRGGADQKAKRPGYQPRQGSPQYAILLALREGKQPMTKASLVKSAEKFQHASATTEARFVGWSASAFLLREGLIRMDGHLFVLTEAGAALADLLGIRDEAVVLNAAPRRTAAETELEKDRLVQAPADVGQRKSHAATVAGAAASSFPWSLRPAAPRPDYLALENKFQVAAQSPAECAAAGKSSHSPPAVAAPPVRPAALLQRLPAQPRGSLTSAPGKLPPGFEPISLRAGSYDVVCLVDTREVAHGRGRVYISSELSRRGVRCELRQLELGDVIWVARHRRTGSELVLDFVVERKTIEDLILSVFNARFAEQLHRLICSGAGSKFYIVEHCAVRTQHEPNMIYSLMAKLQVRDGVTVKRTESTDATIEYIERLTRHLEASLQGRDVLGIPDALLADRATFLETKRRLAQSDPGNTYHVTFRSYKNLNSKRRQLTLGDLFVRFLACVDGVGPVTARKVAKAYKTPRGLMEAFDALQTREAKEAMLKDSAVGGSCPAVAERKVGPVLSKMIAEIWTRKAFAVVGNRADSAAVRACLDQSSEVLALAGPRHKDRKPSSGPTQFYDVKLK